MSHEHLDYYDDEYTFKFNRWTPRYQGKLFYQHMQQAESHRTVAIFTLVEHIRVAKPRTEYIGVS